MPSTCCKYLSPDCPSSLACGSLTSLFWYYYTIAFRYDQVAIQMCSSESVQQAPKTSNISRVLQSDTSVFCPHMVVNALALRERPQAHPANVRLAANACHVVATCATLDRHFTTRAVFDVMRRGPLLEEFILRVQTSFAVMALLVAFPTNPGEARWAL